jgi:hypothetical protein
LSEAAETKIKTDIPIAKPTQPFFTRVYHGYVNMLSKIKSKPVPVKEARGAEARRRQWKHGRGSAYTEIPPITDPAIQEIGFYCVTEPFSYVRVTYNQTTSDYLLSVIEPVLDEFEEETLEMIKQTFTKTLDYEWDKLTVMDKRTYLEKSVDSFIKTRGITLEPISEDKIKYFITRDFVGYGPIDGLMNDGHIEDVSSASDNDAASSCRCPARSWTGPLPRGTECRRRTHER